MPPEKIKINLDIAKIIVGLGATASIIFYAGRLDEQINNNTTRIDKIEDFIYPAPHTYQQQMNKERTDFIKHIKVKPNDCE